MCGQVILGIVNQKLQRSKPIPQDAVIQEKDALFLTLVVEEAANYSPHSQKCCALVDQHYDDQVQQYKLVVHLFWQDMCIRKALLVGQRG